MEASKPLEEKIKSLGLTSNIEQVMEEGYTIISPDKVAPEKFRNDLLNKIIEIAEERTGNRISLTKNTNSGTYKPIPQTDSQFVLYSLLFADPIFEEWLMNDVVQTLSTYFLNNQGQLSSMSSFIKWKGESYKESYGIHADTTPASDGSLPTNWLDACNSVYCLTDYSLENGALGVVPKSHKLGRQPTKDDDLSNFHPVEASKGSIIFWHGNLWHGAYPKKTDGLRINLTTFITHRRIKTQENIKNRVTKEMLKRNPSKAFARMVGLNDHNGFDENGPDMSGIIKFGTSDQMKRFTYDVNDL